MVGHVGMDFSERAPMDTRRGRMVWFGSKNPRPFNRQFTYMARVANVKMPRLLVFARHVEMVITKALKPRSTTFIGGRTLFAATGTLEYSVEEPALQCRRQ